MSQKVYTLLIILFVWRLDIMSDALKKVRSSIAAIGNTEEDILLEQPEAREIFNQIQDAKIKMFEAQIKAFEEAAKPFSKQITELEEEYAIFLKLSS